MTFLYAGVSRSEDEIDVDEEMVVSEDQVLVETEGDESIPDDAEQTDADTYLLFTKPVFEEKTSIGKLLCICSFSFSFLMYKLKSVMLV